MGILGRKPEPVEGCAQKYGFPDPHRIAVLLLQYAGYSEVEIEAARTDYYAGVDNVYDLAVKAGLAHIWGHSQMKDRPVDYSITAEGERGDYRGMLDQWCYPWVQRFGKSQPETIRLLGARMCPGGTFHGRPVDAELWPEALRLWDDALREHPQERPYRAGIQPDQTPQGRPAHPDDDANDGLDAGAALATIRSGERAAGIRALERICAADPSDTGALALAAYELKLRAANEEEFNRGARYLARLEKVAPNARSLHCLKAIDALTDNVTKCQEHFTQAQSGTPSTSADVDLMLHTIADIATGEANYQIVTAQVGQTFRYTVTHRLKAIVLLLQRQPAEAAAEFHAGVEDAGSSTEAVPTRLLPIAERGKYAANIRRDCRFGEWQSLLDLGSYAEAAAVLESARSAYARDYHATPQSGRSEPPPPQSETGDDAPRDLDGIASTRTPLTAATAQAVPVSAATPPTGPPSGDPRQSSAGSTPTGSTRSRRTLFALLGVAAVVVLVMVVSGGGEPNRPTAGAEGVEVAAEEVSGATGEADLEAFGSVPPGFELCPDSGLTDIDVYVNGVTSCPFAENVARSWMDAPGPGVLPAVYSPTTDLEYDMTCSGEGPTLCEGGDDAQVLLLTQAARDAADDAASVAIGSASSAEGLSEAEAVRRLEDLASAGTTAVAGLPDGVWVPQVSSKCAALTEVDYADSTGVIGSPDGRAETFPGGIGDPRILAFHLGLAEQLSTRANLVLVEPQDLGINSNYQDLCGQSTMWISLDLSQPYASSEEALDYCARTGLPFGECAARLIADDTRIELPAGNPPNPSDANTYPVLVNTYLSVRDGPSTDAAEVGRVDAGAYVTIQCTVQGDAVQDPFGDTITLWDRISRPFSGYVSDAFVDTGGKPPVAPAC